MFEILLAVAIVLGVEFYGDPPDSELRKDPLIHVIEIDYQPSQRVEYRGDDIYLVDELFYAK